MLDERRGHATRVDLGNPVGARFGEEDAIITGRGDRPFRALNGIRDELDRGARRDDEGGGSAV
jgi:hypothetical protein